MQPSCHHLYGLSAGTPGNTPLANGFGFLGTGLGPLQLLGLFLLASLVLGMLFWLLQPPRREENALSYAEWHPWREEPVPDLPHQGQWFYSANVPFSCERIQVDYPEIPHEQPLWEQSQKENLD